MKKLLLIMELMLSFMANGQWSELGGTNRLKANGQIIAINTDTIGNIYVGGDFSNMLGKQYVAKFNSSVWSEVGGANSQSFNNRISTIKTVHSSIYASGFFINSILQEYVAKYDGNNWSELGGTNTNFVNSLINDLYLDKSNNIYAVGAFVNSSGKNYVAKFDGNTWTELGGLNSLSANLDISTICGDTLGNIYVAGLFTNASGKHYVAKYDGNSWSELLGSNFNDNIYRLHIDLYGNIYAAGSFINSSGKFYVAKYNGNSWTDLGSIRSLYPYLGITGICSDKLGNIYASGWITNDSNKHYVAKYDGNSWSELGGLNSLAANGNIYSICSDTSGNIYAVGNFTNSLGEYYVAKYSSNILPLTLTSFTTTLQQNNVLLNWHTANEVNVSHFNIQRSTNGKEFTTIGKVDASSVSGYSFLDSDLPNTNEPTLYYRLEIVDKDGSKTYSEIKRVTLNEKQETRKVLIYPNPANSIVTIECSNAKELLIIDYLGRTIKQLKVNSEKLIVDTKEFTKGVYVVKVIMNNGEAKTEKLVIE